MALTNILRMGPKAGNMAPNKVTKLDPCLALNF